MAPGNNRAYRRLLEATLYQGGESLASSEILDGSKVAVMDGEFLDSLARMACLGAGNRLRRESMMGTDSEVEIWVQRNIRGDKRRGRSNGRLLTGINGHVGCFYTLKRFPP